MTSHRRRRSDTKDRKCDSSCGKEKGDCHENQKASLPLFKKSVYIDVKNGKQAEIIEGQLKKLGAVVEKFLSREVNYVISSSAPPTKPEERSSAGDNPASPSCSVPSPFSSIPSPTPPSETKAAVVSRGKALAQIACSRSKASTVVTNAEKWGIKVVAVETASKWLDREIQKIGKERENTSTKKEVTKKEAPKPKKKVVKRKKKTLKGCYIKFEATNEMYRPIKSELDKWPRVNLLAPPGLNPFCDVKMKLHNFLRRHSSMRNARGSLSASSGKCGLKKTRSMSSIKESASLVTTTPQATADVVAVPITTTGDVKRHLGLAHRKRPDRLQGYCECCRIKYKDINEHIKEDDHQSFARDKSNFESLDALITKVPSTSQFLQDILLRHCVQKQTETISHISFGTKEVAAKLDIDVLSAISPLPSEATPHAADGIVPLSVSCPKSPNISRVFSEQEFDGPEDKRPHAVVIRRRTPSGVFVSPRRREPTPSKRPWMQERCMVFRDSPMASLQPSDMSKGLTCAMHDASLATLSQNLYGSPNYACDQSKSKSIVRSLVDMPEFITSSINSSDTDRLSVKNIEEDISRTQKCMESTAQTKPECVQNNETEFQHSEHGTDSTTKSEQINVNAWLEEAEDGAHKESPDMFVPCIADRVKRRSRIEQVKSEGNDTTTISLDDRTEAIQESIGDGKNIDLSEDKPTSSEKEINSCLKEPEKLKSSLSENEITVNSVDSYNKKNKKRSSHPDSSKSKRIDNELNKNVNSQECELDDQVLHTNADSSATKESESNDWICDNKEATTISSTQRQTRKKSKHTQPSAEFTESKDEDINDKITPIKKKTLEKRRNSSKKQETSGRGTIDKRDKDVEKRDVKEKNGVDEASENAARSVRSRMRQCKLFVHEGFYADDKIDFDTVSNIEITKATCNSITAQQETPEKVEEVDESIKTLDNEEKDIPVASLSAKGDSHCEIKINRITESGKRIFRGKKFHTTKADWDLNKEEDISNDCEENEPIRVSVGELVKSRRSCTLFNHKGQYANNGEGGDKNEDEVDNNREDSIGPQSPNHSHCEEMTHSAVVLRRPSTSRSVVTKKDNTWCKFMSKTDWTQFEDDAQQAEALENCSPMNDSADSTTVCSKKPDSYLSPLSYRGTVTPKSHHFRCSSSTGKTHLGVTPDKQIGSELEEFKSPEKANNYSEHSKHEIEDKNKAVVRRKALRKTHHFHKISLNSSERNETSLRSPRLKLKIKKEAGSDCYSSTLEEIHENENMDSGTKWVNIEKNLLISPHRLSNELSPSNHSSRLEKSDSIDLLDTPGRTKYSIESPKFTPVKNIRAHSPLSPQCKRNILGKKSNSKLLRKKRTYSDAERELDNEHKSVDGSFSAGRLRQIELRDSDMIGDETQINSKPSKRRKRNVSKNHDFSITANAEVPKHNIIETSFPSKGKYIKNSNPSNKFSISSINVSDPVPHKAHSLEQTCSRPDMHCDTKSASPTVRDECISSSKSKSNSKSKKRKGKRKLSVSDEGTTELDYKKVKLDKMEEETIGEQASFSKSQICSPQKNAAYNLLRKSKSTIINQDEESNDKLFSERSGSNVGELLNLVPNFSSPGKTNSSWDDACDSYLSTSLKTNDRTPRKHDTIVSPHNAISVAWSPFKHNSPSKSRNSNKKHTLSRTESEYKNGFNTINSDKDTFSNLNSHDCVTPTKRNTSLYNVAGPSVEKIDSVISFNHMSPQRLHFSPIKMKSPVRNSEKSPVVRKIDSNASFGQLSPDSFTFSPSKKSARKHL